jgi:hypothetical protein
MTVSMYVLSLRQTRGGTYSVDRSDWVEFPGPGDWCRMNVRPIKSRLTREGARQFAMRYVAENPGHTRDPRPAALSSTGPRPNDPQTAPDAVGFRARGPHHEG